MTDWNKAPYELGLLTPETLFEHVETQLATVYVFHCAAQVASEWGDLAQLITDSGGDEPEWMQSIRGAMESVVDTLGEVFALIDAYAPAPAALDTAETPMESAAVVGTREVCATCGEPAPNPQTHEDETGHWPRYVRA